MIASGIDWAHSVSDGLPPRWQKKLINRWNHTSRQFRHGDFCGEVHAEAEANREILSIVTSLEQVRLPLDANDADICQQADTLAKRAKELAFASVGKFNTADILASRQDAVTYREPTDTATTMTGFSRGLPELRATLARIAERHDLTPPLNNPKLAAHVEDGPAVARMADPQWWRRQLRRMHARKVEAAAIDLGLVSKVKDCYVSNESVYRRAQQNERNAAALEATEMTNEDGETCTLAELAAKGTANKSIRRAELMTRIAGFERIAEDLGHVGLFMTITAPSRMHKWSTAKGQGYVFENRKYEGINPKQAQAHLSAMYGRLRTELARRGLQQYGFRIAEANHDGTPHWHLLVFIDPAYQGDAMRSAIGRFCAIVRRYALGKGEAGRVKKSDRIAERRRQNSDTARKLHGVDFKPIDKSKGSAAGYIAKYVAKNIDGYRLDKDLFDNDAIQTSHRIEAWASTWGIRQFQQVGGPPVGPWRELRRVESMPASMPHYMHTALEAVNKTKALDLDTAAANEELTTVAKKAEGAKWDKYCWAQGGVFCGRKYRIMVAKSRPEGVNKYGELLAEIAVGVVAREVEIYTPAHMAHMGGKAERRVIVPSKRHTWTRSGAMAKPCAREFGFGFSEPIAATRPWTGVNNCTEKQVFDFSQFEKEPEFMPDTWAGHVEWRGIDAGDTQIMREDIEYSWKQYDKTNSRMSWTGMNGDEAVMRRKITADAVIQAQLQWTNSPRNVRFMVGVYVEPLIDALIAINNELQAKA